MGGKKERRKESYKKRKGINFISPYSCYGKLEKGGIPRISLSNK